jgi:hypothetical protein
MALRHPSLALDSDGSPRIAYCGLDDGDQGYGSWNGAGWDIEEFAVAVDGVVLGCALAMDPWGYPKIGYYDYAHKDLGLASGHDPLAVRWPR